MTSPLTLSYLIEHGLALEVHCRTCGRMGKWDTQGLPLLLRPPDFTGETPVADLHKRFACSNCGPGNIDTRPHYDTGERLKGYGRGG